MLRNFSKRKMWQDVGRDRRRKWTRSKLKRHESNCGRFDWRLKMVETDVRSHREGWRRAESEIEPEVAENKDRLTGYAWIDTATTCTAHAFESRVEATRNGGDGWKWVGRWAEGETRLRAARGQKTTVKKRNRTEQSVWIVEREEKQKSEGSVAEARVEGCCWPETKKQIELETKQNERKRMIRKTSREQLFVFVSKKTKAILLPVIWLVDRKRKRDRKGKWKERKEKEKEREKRAHSECKVEWKATN